MASSICSRLVSVLGSLYAFLVLLLLCQWTLLCEGFAFNDREQAKFVSSLKDFRIILPTRIESSGEFISHSLHPSVHKIVRRSSGGDPNDKQSTSESKLFYNVTLDNVPVHLELQLNTRFIGRQLVVERWKNRYGNLSDVSVKKMKNLHGCHYVGHVREAPSSRAAVATCNGLMGYFIKDNEEYLIEPVKGHSGSIDQGHPHLVYKRSAIPDYLGGVTSDRKTEGSACGVKGDFKREIGRRERWERHRQIVEISKSKKRRRKKRSISTEKHVEALVVIDPIMVEYYANSDLDNYVLTIINMVSSVFHDASIGNAINIVLVKVMLLEEDQPGLKITHHADNSLGSFCKWQKKLNPKGEEHANHHDVAILITRKNICSRMNQPCGTLGLAQVSGMCQPHRSCNINQDTGLSLAYTIAHELGHNFGMRHDGIHNDCDSPNTGSQHVMSSHLIADSVPLVWSSCSRRAITRFLDRNWGYCLDDEPATHDFSFPVLPPGAMYDADHQCRLQYGPKAKICDGIENVCDTLWCRVDNGCSTKLEAAVEGTLCGDNRWCMNGVCQIIGDRPEAINGEWAVWGGWSDCSRTCGAGVSYSERHCNNPPPSNGGKYCIGERKRYKICNVEPCPEDAPSFRHYQCTEFNKKAYKKKFYQWEPVATPNTPCQLHCKPKDNYFSVLLKDIVTDGTSCSQTGRHMCIGGRCRHVGCDWVLNSDAKDDRCGVCHGDGSSCLTVKQQFKDKSGNGYVEATVIPEGARNIRVEEVAEANNYLALRSDGGDYYLNGNWFIQWSGDYDVAGTVVQYRRIGNKESFEAPGPLKEPLHIMLLFQSDNPGVVFEYTVPNQNATERRIPEFKWEFTDFSHCTVSCGGGSQRSFVVCMEREAGHVEDRYCNNTSKPDDHSRACNLHQCPARWWVGPWQHCSVTCGPNGLRRRTAICVRSLGPDEQIALEDSACEGVEKPATVEPCRKKPPCPEFGNWVIGEWENLCNGNPCAYRHRPIECDSPKGGCDPETKPIIKEQCGNITCGVWEAGLWSQCTRSCGGGMQYRNVYCDGGQSCDLEKEPPAERRCRRIKCPLTTTAKPTSTVSSTTKVHSPTTETYTFPTVPVDLVPTMKGNQTENIGSSVPITLSENSTIAKTESKTPKPTKIKDIPLFGNLKSNSKDLDIHTESGITLTEKKDPLSITEEEIEKNFPPLVEEGGYESDRIVNTNTNPRIPEVENVHNLNLGVVNQSIITSDNSETKLTSGQDMESQHVVEIAGKPGLSASKGDNFRQNRGDNSHQLNLQENIKGQPTRRPITYMWLTKEWGKCSKHCGGGVKSRYVLCVESVSKKKVDNIQCVESEQPKRREKCHTMACQEWSASDWHQCSKSCGTGIQRRHVHCPLPHRCDPSHRPAHFRSCHLKPCLNWEPGPWSLCTRTCGKGEQLRLVECRNLTNEKRASGCDEENKPPSRQPCQLMECLKQEEGVLVPCTINKMGYRLCHALKDRGQCERAFVQRKCCKTCGVKEYRETEHNSQRPGRRTA